MVFQALRKKFGEYKNQHTERYETASELYGMGGNPLEKWYKDMERNKLPPNLTMTIKYINNSKYMFVPDLLGVRNKTVRHKPTRLDMEEYVAIAMSFYKLHKICDSHRGCYVCE